MNRRLLLPLLALVLTIGGGLAFAAWNRSETRQRLTLTERELSLPWAWENETADDDGEVRLSIEWQRRGNALDERAWLTNDKLRELGFDMQTPAGAPEAEQRYRRSLPRIAWVVFEYDGPAWRAIEQRRQLRSDAGTPDRADEPARLVPIDAGADRAALTRRHQSTTTIVLPAVVQIGWLPAQSGGPLAYGYVQRLVVGQVSVPTRLRNALTAFRTKGPERAESTLRSPRYEVDLAVGRFGYPWVTAVRAITP